MKITCQSCQSKYNVSDEKVQGRTVKIKCRKCGATIVVNGAGTADAYGSAGAAADLSDAAPMPSSRSGGALATNGAQQWQVNVAEGDQRSMSIDEIVYA